MNHRPSTAKQKRERLASELHLLMHDIRDRDKPHWVMKNTLKSLRPTGGSLAGANWNRKPYKTANYYYAPLYLEGSYSVILFKQDKEGRNPAFGLALLDCDKGVFIEASIDAIMQWIGPKDQSATELILSLDRLSYIVHGVRRVAGPNTLHI